jgi:hypothetical protein
MKIGDLRAERSPWRSPTKLGPARIHRFPCYATVRHLALPYIYDATLLYVFLNFLTYMMCVFLHAERKRRPLKFLTCPVKSTRAFFKEIQLWERCKTTVIYGMKRMMNSASVGNAGSINHPPGCFSNMSWWHIRHVQFASQPSWSSAVQFGDSFPAKIPSINNHYFHQLTIINNYYNPFLGNPLGSLIIS